MNLIARGLFVVGGIAVGSFLVNHFLFGNTGDTLIPWSTPEPLRPLLAQHSDAADACAASVRQAAS